MKIQISKLINIDYLKGFIIDPIYFIRISFKKKQKTNSKKTLIINNGLIGDFLVSIPAIRSYIITNKVNVDLIVSPLVKDISKRIKGIDNVYVVKSIHKRKTELGLKNDNQQLGDYNKIFIIRLSSQTYKLIKNIKISKIYNPLKVYISFALNLISSEFGQKTLQLREFYFKLLEEKLMNLKFEDIFDFNEKDYINIKKKFNFFDSNQKIIIIHTRGSWWSNIWSNDKWITLLKKINKKKNYNLVFIGATEEEADYNYISSKLNFKTYSLINKISFLELMLIMRLSDYFIGIDSGPRNLAHLTELPSITLFGAGPHNIYPFNKDDIYIDKSGGKGIMERLFYKKNGTGFIHRIEADEVYKAFKKLIKRKK